MPQQTTLLPLAALLPGLSCVLSCTATSAAEREDVRKVINLVAAVKMPNPDNLTSTAPRLNASGSSAAAPPLAAS
jgi:hypothetical protein